MLIILTCFSSISVIFALFPRTLPSHFGPRLVSALGREFRSIATVWHEVVATAARPRVRRVLLTPVSSVGLHVRLLLRRGEQHTGRFAGRRRAAERVQCFGNCPHGRISLEHEQGTEGVLLGEEPARLKVFLCLHPSVGLARRFHARDALAG